MTGTGHSKAAEGEPQHEHGQRIKTGVLALYFVGISVFTILFILVTVLARTEPS